MGNNFIIKQKPADSIHFCGWKYTMQFSTHELNYIFMKG